MRELNFLMVMTMMCCGQTAIGQFSDSFSDGEFLTAPPWQGDAARFAVTGNRLRLQAPAQSGTASLATPSMAVHAASWMFRVQLDFTPSSTNYAKVYLMADMPDLGSPVQGYFVKIGGISREISLYRQTGSAEVKVIDGLDDRVNQVTVSATIRVLRSEAGTWELAVDVGNTGSLQREGEATDITHTSSAWFGVYCVYTSTRSDRFWFDDFMVEGMPVPDKTPPSVVSVQALDANRIMIRFSEPIDPENLASKINVEGIGSPVSVSMSSDSLNAGIVLGTSMVNGRTYSLHINGVPDRLGNGLHGTWPVMFFLPGIPAPKSVLITEVLADPSPQVGLPVAEYVEVYNATNEPFDLTHWTLTDGSSTGVIGSAILLPQAYLVLTSTASVPLFKQDNVVGLTNFPSLNNAGDKLVLKEAGGLKIDSVNYATEWFHDEDKEQGGWALELIDTSNPCGEEENWGSSEDVTGGTPGTTNSIAANKPDLTPPNMLVIAQPDPTHLHVTFNELLQQPMEVAVWLQPPVAIASVALFGAARRGLAIELERTLVPRTAYTLHLSGIRDCAGNVMNEALLEFGVEEPADSGDIVISEILFNPRSNGVDFVELFNRSEKFIQLQGWQLSNGIAQTIIPRFLLHPKQWVALTEDPTIVRAQYASPFSASIIRADVPSMPDAEGVIMVTDSEANEMDSVIYSADWHSVFLKETEGVSLERLEYSVGSIQDNWVSASAREGFATPGRANSQQGRTERGEDQIEIVPQVLERASLSDSFVQIRYRFESAGRVVNIAVLNHQGSVVRQIAENEWLGTEGFFRWDGDRSDGERVPAGYYIVWVEWFDGSGNQGTDRKRVIVLGR